MKLLSSFSVALLLLSSCKTLNSYTTIKPNDSFVLGNNEHGSFRVNLTNLSKSAINIYQMPVGGESLASGSVAPKDNISITVARNTALIISNNTADTASVKLKVTGDIGLAMQYKE